MVSIYAQNLRNDPLGPPQYGTYSTGGKSIQACRSYGVDTRPTKLTEDNLQALAEASTSSNQDTLSKAGSARDPCQLSPLGDYNQIVHTVVLPMITPPSPPGRYTWSPTPPVTPSTPSTAVSTLADGSLHPNVGGKNIGLLFEQGLLGLEEDDLNDALPGDDQEQIPSPIREWLAQNPDLAIGYIKAAANNGNARDLLNRIPTEAEQQSESDIESDAESESDRDLDPESDDERRHDADYSESSDEESDEDSTAETSAKACANHNGSSLLVKETNPNNLDKDNVKIVDLVSLQTSSGEPSEETTYARIKSTFPNVVQTKAKVASGDKSIKHNVIYKPSYLIAPTVQAARMILAAAPKGKPSMLSAFQSTQANIGTNVANDIRSLEVHEATKAISKDANIEGSTIPVSRPEPVCKGPKSYVRKKTNNHTLFMKSRSVPQATQGALETLKNEVSDDARKEEPEETRLNAGKTVPNNSSAGPLKSGQYPTARKTVGNKSSTGSSQPEQYRTARKTLHITSTSRPPKAEHKPSSESSKPQRAKVTKGQRPKDNSDLQPEFSPDNKLASSIDHKTMIPVNSIRLRVPYPAPTSILNASHEKYKEECKKTSRKIRDNPDIGIRANVPWTIWEDDAVIKHMLDIRLDPNIPETEARFKETSRRLKVVDNIDRTEIAVKNMWNRVGRARSGFDERKRQNEEMATSLQAGKKRKRGNETASGRASKKPNNNN